MGAQCCRQLGSQPDTVFVLLDDKVCCRLAFVHLKRVGTLPCKAQATLRMTLDLFR
jgi:hypothetical protein